MLWRVSRPLRSRSKPDGFILPCQPALADRPPSGPDWLHEIKFDGYRVIARKDGDRVRLWARTTSDYSKAFTRIRSFGDFIFSELTWHQSSSARSPSLYLRCFSDPPFYLDGMVRFCDEWAGRAAALGWQPSD